VGNVIVELTQVRGLVDAEEIRVAELYALIELLVDHRYGRERGGLGDKVWEPFAWSDVTSETTARPRSLLALLGVMVAVGGAIGGLGLLVIATLGPNLSPSSVWLWLQVATLAWLLKVCVLEPAVILLDASFLQCVEGHATLRGVVEAQLYEAQQQH
jgi:hypothetical protein